MRYYFLLALLCSQVLRAQEPIPNVIRVNPLSTSTAEFHSLQAAVNAWVPGYEIWVENVCTGPWLSCSSFIENVNINVPAIIRGSGYFLGINNIYSDINDLGSFGTIHLAAGSSGCNISGLIINQLIISASFTNVESCLISNVNCLSSNNFIERNYIQAASPGQLSLRFGGFGNTIRNNFIGSFDGTAPSTLSIEQLGSFPNFFVSNTVAGGLSRFQSSILEENIFFNHQFENIDDCIITFNLFNQSMPALPEDTGGEVNDQCQVFCNSSNQFNLDTPYFIGGVGDMQWMPIDFSPAVGITSNGGTAGMYDGEINSYRTSGLSLDPLISSMDVLPCVEPGITLMPVTIISTSTTEIPVLVAEYFFDQDPGIGLGIPYVFTDALLGPMFMFADIASLEPGVHIIGLRLIDFNGNFSLTQERSFEIKPENVLANIIGFEYVIDTDNGFGTGTFVSTANPESSVDFTTIISASNLSEGFHQIMFRSYDSDGSIGVTQVKTVFWLDDENGNGVDDPNTEIVSLFVGSDPGIDNTPEFSISNLDNFGSVLSFMFEEEGFHDVNIRVKDNFGQWSTTQVKSVYVLREEEPTPNLERIEYYIDNDPGYNDSPSFILPQQISFEGLFTVPLEGVIGGYHTLFFRSKDVSGDFSTTQKKLVYVMDGGFMAADLNDDGIVNITDLLILISNYGCSSLICIGDITGDGVTNITDLLTFISYLGEPGPPPVGP